MLHQSIDHMLSCDHGDPEKTRMNRFRAVPTTVAIQALADVGYTTVQAQGMRSRSRVANPYGKHLVRMRHNGATPTVGDNLPEIVLLNANDGTSSLRLLAGLYRLVCSNGLIVATAQIAAITIRHSSPRLVAESVRDAAADIAARTALIGPTVAAWQALPMPIVDQEKFAREAMTLRGIPSDSPIRPYQVIGARRTEDLAENLWTVFNRVQENLSRPGIAATRVREDGSRRRISLRALRNVPQTVNFNTKLWELADRYANTH
jgi:Domain of unknown function (DUF932)